MKTLTEMQKTFITSSALNNGKTDIEIAAIIAKKELELNKPKKATFNWSNFDDENESGMM